jgi:hypothetical protein
MASAMDEFDFEVETPWGVICFSELTDEDWSQIKKICRKVIEAKLTKEVSRAYVLAFHYFIRDKIEFLKPFDDSKDVIN